MTSGMVIFDMKKHFQVRAIEWWSAGAMASWGLWSLLHPGMFLANRAMEGLLAFAPQHLWGLVAFCAGGLRLVALFINGLWHRTPSIRWLTSMVSILIWFAITASLARSSLPSVGVVVYLWHILADMYSASRSASDYVEAKTQEELKKRSITLSEEGTNVRSISTR